MPDDFMRRVFSLVSVTLPAKGTYAIANVFLPRTDKGRQECKRLVEASLQLLSCLSVHGCFDLCAKAIMCARLLAWF